MDEKTMTYRIGKTSNTLRESNRRKIKKAINDNANITFGELLDLKIVSREPLNRHLNKLLHSGEVEKYFNKAKNRLVYRLTVKAKIPMQIESMIQNLGSVATHTVFARKMKKKPKLDINAEIENYIKAKSRISPKKFYQYLEENYPLIFG